jgi:hypothetical protein
LNIFAIEPISAQSRKWGMGYKPDILAMHTWYSAQMKKQHGTEEELKHIYHE